MTDPIKYCERIMKNVVHIVQSADLWTGIGMIVFTTIYKPKYKNLSFSLTDRRGVSYILLLSHHFHDQLCKAGIKLPLIYKKE